MKLAKLKTFDAVSDGVVPADWEKGVQACAPHGGVTKIFRPNYRTGKYEILCKNGATIYLDREK